MGTPYLLHIDGPEFDQEIECADLDEALTHLRELITSDGEDADGARFERYGVTVESNPYRAK
jgi:hypothetical protein